MRKAILSAFALLLLTISITAVVSAGTVELEIITYANHDVTVNILDPVREDPLLMTLEDNTGQDAKAEFNFETGVSKIDIWVGVKKSDKLVVYKKFEGYTSSGQISLSVLKESAATNQTANSTNQAANNTANQTANSTTVPASNQTAGLTAAATTDNSSINASNNETGESTKASDLPVIKIVMYTIGIIAILLVIAGIVLFIVFRNKGKFQKDIKVKKYSDLKEEIKERNKTADEKKIDELEKSIKGLQEEVDNIKNKKSKIKEVEERIKKDMAELERLKK